MIVGCGSTVASGHRGPCARNRRGNSDKMRWAGDKIALSWEEFDV
jgi:hypothetical protein